MLLSGALLLASMAACASSQPPAMPAVSSNVAASTTAPANVELPPPAAEGINGSIIIATQNETPSIAPARHITVTGHYKNRMTHNGLFRTNYEDLEPVPDLVKSWTALSDVLFEFTLHEGILFHNGEEMTAEDVVASFYYVREFPEAKVAHLSALEAEVVDTYTFTIYTGEPNAGLFSDLTHTGNFIMPKSLIDSGHDFQSNPIGSGPFVFGEWKYGDSMTFTAFENYFDTDRAPKIENVTWRFIPEGTSRTISLETGEVDYVVEVPEADVPRLEASPDVTVFMRPATGYNFILLNNSLPQFENLVVRQALNMAVDQEALVTVAFEGLATPIREHLPRVFPGTSSEGLLPFDPEGAKALLAEHNIDPATLAFDMVTSTEERRRMAEVVQAQMLDIGIPTTITMNDHATTIQRSLDAEYEALFGMVSSANLISLIRLAYHGGIEGAPNRSRVNLPELNDLIDQGIATIDADARNAVFEQASRLINENVFNIPTHIPMTIRAFSSKLVAPEISATGDLNINMIYWAQ